MALASLMVVAGAPTFGYLAWSGSDAAAFLARHPEWGLLGAFASGAVTVRTVMGGAERRGIPIPAHRGGGAWPAACCGGAAVRRR